MIAADDGDELADETVPADADRGTGAPEVVELPDIGALAHREGRLREAAAVRDVKSAGPGDGDLCFEADVFGIPSEDDVARDPGARLTTAQPLSRDRAVP